VSRLVIGVTGPIASGKSSVSARLAEHGAVIIDADLVYRSLIGPGMELTRRLADRFGNGILADDGAINRKALGAIVFSDAAALEDLDRITHPAIIAAVKQRLETLDEPLVVIEAVKLSKGTGQFCNELWLVQIDPAIQLERLVARNNITREDAERRIAAQMTYDPAHYTRILHNDGTLDDLHAAVDAALATALTIRSATSSS
jgi:dephospho-CoA kinase